METIRFGIADGEVREGAIVGGCGSSALFRTCTRFESGREKYADKGSERGSVVDELLVAPCTVLCLPDRDCGSVPEAGCTPDRILVDSPPERVLADGPPDREYEVVVDCPLDTECKILPD